MKKSEIFFVILKEKCMITTWDRPKKIREPSKTEKSHLLYPLFTLLFPLKHTYKQQKKQKEKQSIVTVLELWLGFFELV